MAISDSLFAQLFLVIYTFLKNTRLRYCTFRTDFLSFYQSKPYSIYLTNRKYRLCVLFQPLLEQIHENKRTFLWHVSWIFYVII